MSTDIFRRYIDIVSESAPQSVTEMDKSQPSHGRDGHVSHSTYGSRDKEGSDYFKGKESPVKPISVKQMEKDALDILKKQGVAEGKVSGYKMYPNHDGTWYVEDEHENVVLRNASEGEAEYAVWSGNEKLKQGVAEGTYWAGSEGPDGVAIDDPNDVMPDKKPMVKKLGPKARAKTQMLKMYGDGEITFRKTSNGGYFIQHEDDFGDTHSHQYDPKTGKVDFSGVTRTTYYGEGVAEVSKPTKKEYLKKLDQNRKDMEDARKQGTYGAPGSLKNVDWVKKQGVVEGSDKAALEKELDEITRQMTIALVAWQKNSNNPLAAVSYHRLKKRKKEILAQLKQDVEESTKSLADYMAESERAYSKPVTGDYFAINIREETLFETWVCDETPDGIVIYADDRGMALLEQYGYLGEPVMEMHHIDDYEADSDGSEVDVVDRGEYDYEGDQAKDQLRTIVRAARRLNGMLDDDDNLPEWVQMKITKAEDYIDTAADYMESNREQGVAESTTRKKAKDFISGTGSYGANYDTVNDYDVRGIRRLSTVLSGKVDPRWMMYAKEGLWTIEHDSDYPRGEWYTVTVTDPKHFRDFLWLANETNPNQEVITNSVQGMAEAKYQGREVPLGKPMAGDVKKSKVYVRGPKGNVVKVNFGQKGMKIKKNIPGRRKNFRARHNCDNPGPRHKARFWSCRAW